MEKNRLAFTSFLIALGMTLLKVVVGWNAGSLGILSDAAHSALDTLAVLFTYLAVRVAAKPADVEHTYGHGKIESLAAFVQTGLLLLACIWILQEAFERILFKEARVHAGWWTFAVMALSIVVNFSRSRVLSRAAQKYSSQALEADAIHFNVDMLTDILVIVGLVFARAGAVAGIDKLGATGDAVAAISVAAITLWLSLRLGKRAFDVLMDRAPVGVVDLVKREAEQLDGVIDAHRIRVRRSGATVFVDLHVSVPRNLSSERSHWISEEVERRVREIIPLSQLLVHVDPISTDDETVYERIHLIARNHAMTIHNLNVYHEKKRMNADLHLEVNGKLDIREAHEQASKLERWIRQELPEISAVNIHIEGRGNEVEEGIDVTAEQEKLVAAVRRVVDNQPEIIDAHNIHVRQIGERLCVYLHCTFANESVISRVHDLSTRIEDVLRAETPDLGQVFIHTEPTEKR